MRQRYALRVCTILLLAGLSLLLATCSDSRAPRFQRTLLLPSQEEHASNDGGRSIGLPSVSELDELVSSAHKGVRQGGQVVSYGADYDPAISGSTSENVEAIEEDGNSLNLRAYEVGDYTYAIFPQLVGDGEWGGGRDDEVPLQSLIGSEVCRIGGGRDDEVPLVYYIGFADYSVGSWLWYGPFTTTNPEVILNSDDLEDRFKSPTDMLYIAVLTTAAGKETSQLPREGLVAPLPFEPAERTASQLEDPVGVRVNLVTTDTDSGIGTLPQIVTGLEAVAGESSVILSWDVNPDPHVTMHQVFRQNITTKGAMEPLTQVFMPALEYEDTSGELEIEYRYAARAVNDLGAGGRSFISIVYGRWRRMIVDSAGRVGEYSSLLVVNGCPAISYYDYDNGDLKYIRADNASGTSWGIPVVVDTAGDVGANSSLAVVNGYPAISYYDASNSELKYVQATNENGSYWGFPVTVAISGLYCSLAVVNGYPAVSYRESGYSRLMFVRATDSNGSAWDTPIILDSEGDFYISLAIVNGYPAVSYVEGGWDDLKYIRALDVDGNLWGVPVIVDEGAGYTSLAVVDGFPAISYYDDLIGVKYVRATNADGSSWGPPVIIDNESCTFTSLAVINGYPAISYHAQAPWALRYVQAANIDGSVWGVPVIVDRTVGAGGYTSLSMVDGSAAISYFDSVNMDLKYARVY